MNEDDRHSCAGVGDVREWCLHQLEAGIKKLTEKVAIITYSRSPESLTSVAQQCDDLEAILTACEFQLQQFEQHDEQDYEHCVGSLMLVEAHQMLADARALVRVPLEPVWRGDNVIELKPNYSDLTDAAFERMLASSDIPQFLSMPGAWADADEQMDAQNEIKQTRAKPALTLVHSRDLP